MILAGKTVTVIFADGRRVTVEVTHSDELRFEQREKIALPRVLGPEGALPLWVIAGIVHWRLLRSELPDIPKGLDDFIDMLDPIEWLEVNDEGKAEASDPTPDTG